MVIDNESIAAKSNSSHSDSGYNTVSSKSQTSSAVHTDFEIDLDADPEVFYSTATMSVDHNYMFFLLLQLNYIATRLTSFLSGIKSFPASISIQSKLSEVPPLNLYSAVFNGKITEVLFLIEVLHCNIHKCSNEQGHIPLHTAAACGDLNMVKFFIEDKNSHAASKSTMNKETPLHLAALNGHLHIVKYLVSTQLMDPTSLDNNDCSPLHNACRSGNLDVVKYLMSEIQRHQPLDVNEKAIDGITPIHFAAESGNPSLIRFLLKELKPSFQVIADCDVHSKDKVLIIRIYTI